MEASQGPVNATGWHGVHVLSNTPLHPPPCKQRRKLHKARTAHREQREVEEQVGRPKGAGPHTRHALHRLAAAGTLPVRQVGDGGR